jgi:parallel beta-helix repeat protein
MKYCCVLLLFILSGILANVTAQKKTVNILDFGAKPNDEKFDNTKNIASALEFANLHNIKNIRIPEGIYYLSSGFNLNDSICIFGDGMNKTILRIMKGLLPRTEESTQTAIFTGKHSFSLSHSSSTKQITIKSLTIDLQKNADEYDISKFPMLGAIRLINPIHCLIDSVKIILPQKFGIGLYATQSGTNCSYNVISNSEVQMQPNWYLQLTPEIIPRSNESCIGIEIASFIGQNNNGTALYLNRKNNDYFNSKIRSNKIFNSKISGGSHGISLSNARENKIYNNSISGASARGIILSACSDSNLISKNTISQSGSTGIHLAYDCNYNIIISNKVKGVLGVEGDGIKSYVNCNYNKIEKNTVSDFAKAAIRVSHGANDNLIESNVIYGSNTNTQVGIKIIANNKIQYDLGLTYENKLTAYNNRCNKNIIKNVDTGIVVEDELNIFNSTKNNQTSFNKFRAFKKN